MSFDVSSRDSTSFMEQLDELLTKLLHNPRDTTSTILKIPQNQFISLISHLGPEFEQLMSGYWLLQMSILSHRIFVKCSSYGFKSTGSPRVL